MVCEVLPIIAGLRGSALSTLVVGATPAQSPDRPVSEAVRQVSHQSSYDGEDDAVSRAASSVYDHEMEDHYTALLPDDVKARDNAFFNGFYPRKLASRSSSHTNIYSNSVPSLPTSGRYSLREDLGLARTSSRRELQSNGNLSGRSYGELSDSGYRERRARLDQPPAQKSNFSVFLPWTWFEDE